MGEPDLTRHTHDAWREQSSLIRVFLERRPLYQKLCSEVAYSLEHAVKAANIEIAAVTSRAKTLNSLLEKVFRKTYANPLEDITDLAGVRVVHLYHTDFELIQRIIEQQFDVIEHVDKLAEQGADRFGYAAKHFLVRLGTGFSGARYDELKTLTCEIQVRTTLQDAWSIISHHLMYKRESSIPSHLRRRINSLAGLLETADDQFVHIRSDREGYVAKLEQTATNENGLFRQEIDAESVAVFLKARFPDMKMEVSPLHVNAVLGDLDNNKYQTIGDLDSAITRTTSARAKFDESHSYTSDTACGILAVAIGFDDPAYRQEGWDPESQLLFRKYEHLIEGNDS